MDGDDKNGKLEDDRESGNVSPWEEGLSMGGHPWEKELVAVSTATEEEEAISGHRSPHVGLTDDSCCRTIASAHSEAIVCRWETWDINLR